VLSALAELREFAHGIFPAILDEAGLAPHCGHPGRLRRCPSGHPFPGTAPGCGGGRAYLVVTADAQLVVPVAGSAGNRLPGPGNAERPDRWRQRC
jgi:hypothetical protein